MKSTRIIIVEDDAALRTSLTDWLAQEFTVTCFESAEAFLEAINDFEFEDGIQTCILLDFQMPGMTGVELQKNLKLMNVECPIIFMSGNAQQFDIVEAWRGGAVDFLLKPFSGLQVSTALADLFKKIEITKPKDYRVPANEVILDIPISQREAEVLTLLGKGHRQAEVAEMLKITLRTVKMHRANLKSKLGLNTLIDLTRYCDEHKASIAKITKT